MARTSTLERPKPFKREKRGRSATQTPVEKGVRTALHTNSKAACALVDEDKPLTAQQMAFVQAWARGESIASAAERAGYRNGDSYCYRMTVMPNVLKVYHHEKALYEAAAQMTRQRVMDGLLEGIEMAKLMAEPASMISGWREIGKMCGYYEPVKHVLDVTVKGEVTMRQLNNLSDSDLLKIITSPGAVSLPDLTPPKDA